MPAQKSTPVLQAQIFKSMMNKVLETGKNKVEKFDVDAIQESVRQQMLSKKRLVKNLLDPKGVLLSSPFRPKAAEPLSTKTIKPLKNRVVSDSQGNVVARKFHLGALD